MYVAICVRHWVFFYRRYITKFNVLKRDGTPLNHTRHVTLWDPKIVYISISWSPVNNDKGHHIICANAEDSAGYLFYSFENYDCKEIKKSFLTYR